MILMWYIYVIIFYYVWYKDIFKSDTNKWNFVTLPISILKGAAFQFDATMSIFVPGWAARIFPLHSEPDDKYPAVYLNTL
jgi:hypothetical protein